jgi:RNA recognition motif-containing protein
LEFFLNIYVGNLPFSTTEDDLRELFTEFGEVLSAKVIKDRETGRSRGFGFIEMSDNSARTAITELDGSEFDGNDIRVNESKPKTQRFGGNRNRNDRGRGGW